MSDTTTDDGTPPAMPLREDAPQVDSAPTTPLADALNEAQDDLVSRTIESDEPSHSELRRAAVAARLMKVKDMAVQAKRQNMLDQLADAVVDLVDLLSESLSL